MTQHEIPPDLHKLYERVKKAHPSMGWSWTLPLFERIAQLTAELAAMKNPTVEDGFGSVWLPCQKHGILLEVMKPGDARCPWCALESYAEKLTAELAEANRVIERLSAPVSDWWHKEARPIIDAIGEISVQEAMDAIERDLR